MIEKMKSIRPEKAFFNVPDSISIDKLKTTIEDNAPNDIKYFETSPSCLIQNTMSYECYVFLQALTKILDWNIQIKSTTLASPDEQAITTFHSTRFPINTEQYTVTTVFVSKSLFNRNAMKTLRNNIEPINDTLDKMLYEITPEHNILGVTKHNKELFFFLDKTIYAPQVVEYILLGLIYRFFVPTTTVAHPEVHNTFKAILTEITTYKNVKNQYLFFDDIYRIYCSYLDLTSEYKLNKTAQLAKLINSLKERKLRSYADDLENKRANVNTYKERLENAIREFKKANMIYTSLLEKTEDQYTLIPLQEMQELLERSPIIKSYEVVSDGVIFRVEQPLEINSKEDFERILQHKQEQPKWETSLLREALIDEKYKLYTYAYIYINLIRERISNANGYEVPTDAIPHPHLMGFNCFGTYSNLITDLIAKGKYLEAIEETIAAAQGLNWSDSPVISKLYYYLDYYDTINCIELETGARISPHTYKIYKEELEKHDEAISNQAEETATTNLTAGQAENGPADRTE